MKCEKHFHRARPDNNKGGAEARLGSGSDSQLPHPSATRVRVGSRNNALCTVLNPEPGPGYDTMYTGYRGFSIFEKL